MTRAEKLKDFFWRNSRQLRVCEAKGGCACTGCTSSLAGWWKHHNPEEAPITKDELDKAILERDSTNDVNPPSFQIWAVIPQKNE